MANQRQRAAEQLLQLRGRSPCIHPWNELSQACRELGLSTVPLVGYGSLISAESASRTLVHSSTSSMRVVTVFGVRRLFNYRMPSAALQRWGASRDSAQSAALNVQVTYSPDDDINAVVIQVSFDDLPGLRERERHYDLFQIPVAPWQEETGEIATAFILSEQPGRQRDPGEILPHPGYLRLCRQACEGISESFVREFDRSTWLADGATTLAQYLSQDRQGMPR